MQHALSSRFGGVVGEQGLDPGRIIASAGALAIHVVVLLLLLVPAKLPPLAPEAVRLPDIRIIPRRQPVPVVPVPVEVAPPTAIPDPKPVAATPRHSAGWRRSQWTSRLHLRCRSRPLLRSNRPASPPP